MQRGRVDSQAGYAAMAGQLAQQALTVASDSAPHRAREGERRWEMARALPAARVLVETPASDDDAKIRQAADALAQTLADPAGKVTDGFGHSRPIYRWLALHLMTSAAKLTSDREVLGTLGRAARACNTTGTQSDRDDPRLAVWSDLIAAVHGESDGVSADWPGVDEPTPLVGLGREDLIDAWTYRELVGLHGLHLRALLTGEKRLSDRVERAALYHLGHTQPDYTTYQPWGLAAFASDPETAVFAEQQLHDVATHLSIEGPGGAVLPALLLADASATMSGRWAGAWRS